MRSIRVSLVVSFLALLAAALGVIGLLVNRTMQQTLQEKNEQTRRLARALHNSRVRDAHMALEKTLYRRATTLAKLAKSHSAWSVMQDHSGPLAVLPAVCRQPAFPLLALWELPPENLMGPRTPVTLGGRLRRMSLIRIQDAEVIMSAPDPEEMPTVRHAREYFQVYNEEGVPTQRSEALPEGTFVLDRKQHDELGGFEYEFDNLEIAPDTPVRRITLRVPVPAYRWSWGNPPSRGPGRRDQRAGPPERWREDVRSRTFFVQCAVETEARDALIQKYKQELQDDLDQLDADSRSALVSLRQRLLLVGLLTFGVTILGGFWLVRLGLSPLERLTSAVSQVSEKDFRLPVGDEPMPRELTPIVKRLTETLEQLRRAFEREKQAAADISHELRTPLSALLATTDVALRKGRTSEEYRAALQDCRASGRRMSQLIERLLALARLDAGVDPLQRKEVEVTEVAEVCTALIRPLAEAKGLQLRYHEAPPMSVYTDPDKLQEVLQNLLHNAIEYNREHGSIDVRVARDNGSVVVEVADTGIGISPLHKERIFERFYRADPSRQADGLHAGLGLAITKSYVELMGGHISVDSREGAGSTFRIELPVGQSR